jgi:DNA-binding HxlR family transcriptional regulator
LAEARCRSAWISRKLRLLRAHGLIYKITHTHRYQLTTAGRSATTAILTALRSTIRQLTTTAAA